MIFESQGELKDRIEEVTPRRVYGRVKVFEDTTSYMAIEAGAVLRLDGNDYYVMGDTKEGRFGIDEQPKFWVKYAVDLTTGAQKIVKLVFHEQFTTTLGPIHVRCVRSPEKESAFLALVRGNPRFMQGETIIDPAGNAVRVIDFIKGPSFFGHIGALQGSHEAYFHEQLPALMAELVACIEALAEVHRRGQQHGDVRNDHLLRDNTTGRYAWIDFDYEVNVLDYDTWSMGSLITYATARGIVTFRAIQRNPERFPHFAGYLDEHDALALYPYRLANLRRVYPYIPRDLNDVLMRFSAGTIDFYEDLDAQARDLRQALGLPPAGDAL